MLFKYVVLHVTPHNEPETDIPVLIPAFASHLDARWMYRDSRVISAGEVELSAEGDELVVNCYGEALDLKVKSRKEVDDALLREVFKDRTLVA
jgi:hypothetical protein